jgi:hypothetical protein
VSKFPVLLEEAPRPHQYGNQRAYPFGMRTSKSHRLLGQENREDAILSCIVIWPFH